MSDGSSVAKKIGSALCRQIKKVNAYDINIQKQESYLKGLLPATLDQNFLVTRLQKISSGI